MSKEKKKTTKKQDVLFGLGNNYLSSMAGSR